MPCYGLMLPDYLRIKKIKNVYGVFWVPTLPYKIDVKQSNRMNKK